jgi:hypothetical protein
MSQSCSAGVDIVVIAFDSIAASTAPPGRYHSTRELTMPKSNRLTRSGGRSPRSDPPRRPRDQRGEPVVDRPAAPERVELDVAVPAHPEQQGDRRQVGD